MSAYDMVWFGGSVGRVLFFVRTSDKPIQAMVELCRLVSEQSCYSVVRPLGHHTNALVPLGCLSPAVAWWNRRQGDVEVLRGDVEPM